MNPVIIFCQKADSRFGGFFVIKFNPQSTFRQFSVMIDADILDTHIMFCQQGGNRSDGARFVRDIHGEYIFRLDRTVGTVGKGIPVGTCGIKEQIECIFVLPVKIGGQHSQILYVGL